MTSTRSERTRARILVAARSLLEERGYHGVGLETVALQAGVSRQSIYVHFGSKANLLLALVAGVDADAGLADLSAAIDQAATGIQALERFIDLVASLTPQVYETAAVLESARRTDPDAETAWRDRMNSRRGTCECIVTRLAAEGSLATGWTPAEATDLLWTMSGLRVWEDLVVECGWPADRFRSHLVQVLVAALVVR